MAEQTFDGAVRWIIIDDCEPAQAIDFDRSHWGLEHVKPRPAWRAGANTQARNLLAALSRVESHERVAIIEDDDVYMPDWLATVDQALTGRVEMVGEGRAYYYNVQQRVAREMRNTEHASLCATAVTGHALDVFRGIVSAGARKFIDLVLWREFTGRKVLLEGHRVVGIKGMPGRAGIGIGHGRTFGGTHDPEGEILASWIGHHRARAVLEAAKGVDDAD
jgi:hypothetical protein